MLEKIGFISDIHSVRDNELEWLAEQARGRKFIYELGSYLGRSTIALAHYGSLVCAVDDFRGATNYPLANGEKSSVLEQFIKNTAPYSNIHLLVTTHERFQPINECDMVFIDGDHTYEAVKRDISKFMNHKNIFICGHDYSWWPGVREAVEVMFGNDFKLFGQQIWYVQR